MIHLHTLQEIEPKEFLPGFFGKMIHTEHMTLAYWDIKSQAQLPTHEHPHEQVVNMIKGEFELTVDGVPHVLTAGMVYVISGNVPHSGKALTDCQILDVFQPAREEYR